MKRKICLRAPKWQAADVDGITERFIKLKFRNTGEIMKCRVYDLLNTNRLSSAKVEEMILALYRWYSEDPAADEDMAAGIRKQDFDYGRWRREHRDYSAVTVEDIVLQEGINRKAVIHIYDRVVRSFYRSEQYDSHEYRYYSYKSLKRSMNNEQTGKEYCCPDLGESCDVDRGSSRIYRDR